MNISKITQQIDKDSRDQGIMRDPSKVTELFRKGRLCIGGRLVQTEKIFSDYKLCVRIINDIYEGQWDIEYRIRLNTDSKGRNKITYDIKSILILFPEITITNRDRKSHLIKDLLVSIPFTIQNNSNPRLLINSIRGARLTLAYDEYYSNYSHSHLSQSRECFEPSQPFPYFSGFCTGSGQINIYMSNLNGDGISEEEFTKYALQILSLVSYESIEGNPYRFMRDIRATASSGSRWNNNITTSGGVFPEFKTYVLNYYRNNGIQPDFRVTRNSQGLYVIEDIDSFTEFVTSVEFSEDAKSRYYCSISANGTVFRYNSATGFPNPPNTSSKKMIFRGEEKTLTIGNPPTTDTSRSEVHPQLITTLKNNLEYELNKNKIRQSTLDRYKDQSEHARESVPSGAVPV